MVSKLRNMNWRMFTHSWKKQTQLFLDRKTSDTCKGNMVYKTNKAVATSCPHSFLLYAITARDEATPEFCEVFFNESSQD
jgi:hypothetical protein